MVVVDIVVVVVLLLLLLLLLLLVVVVVVVVVVGWLQPVRASFLAAREAAFRCKLCQRKAEKERARERYTGQGV